MCVWGNWGSKEFHLFCKDICWATSENVKVSVYMWSNYLLLFSTTTVYVWLHCIKVESAICKKISSWRSKPCCWNRSSINQHLEIPMVTKKHKTMPLVWSCFSLLVLWSWKDHIEWLGNSVPFFFWSRKLHLRHEPDMDKPDGAVGETLREAAQGGDAAALEIWTTLEPLRTPVYGLSHLPQGEIQTSLVA